MMKYPLHQQWFDSLQIVFEALQSSGLGWTSIVNYSFMGYILPQLGQLGPPPVPDTVTLYAGGNMKGAPALVIIAHWNPHQHQHLALLLSLKALQKVYWCLARSMTWALATAKLRPQNCNVFQMRRQTPSINQKGLVFLAWNALICHQYLQGFELCKDLKNCFPAQMIDRQVLHIPDLQYHTT
jgi:hypothetical protein